MIMNSRTRRGNSRDEPDLSSDDHKIIDKEVTHGEDDKY
jgi:hypothetical protein